LALDAHTEAALLDELRGQTTPLLGAMNVRLQVRTALGRIDQRLVAVAEELDSDLVVVGSHQREGFRRWWHGSASSGVLHSSPMSVGVVPFSATNPAVTRSEATGVNLSHQ
jgi:nucleotide-binding universal stress UspA family protein